MQVTKCIFLFKYMKTFQVELIIGKILGIDIALESRIKFFYCTVLILCKYLRSLICGQVFRVHYTLVIFNVHFPEYSILVPRILASNFAS